MEKAYDNASHLNADIPTYAHYLRSEGYETTLAGKMHFVGPDQLHGFENRLTSDIYPGDFGWAVNWDEPDRRLEWYHNMSSVLQAGPCVRSNQLDYDEEVMYKVSSPIKCATQLQGPWVLSKYASSSHCCMTETKLIDSE
jgi:arylsulfatase A-like enzyme